jgi:flagellar biosynthesis protein FliR
MHGELSISLSLLYGFALTLVRLSGMFVFLPFPGSHAGGAPARIMLALASTLAVSPRWPDISGPVGTGEFVSLVVREAVLGALTGVATAFIAEAFVLAAQVLSLPAGYAYASTFDPNTQADSGILLIFAQLTAGLLFFAFGLDRHLIRAFAASLESCPPGTFRPTAALVSETVAVGTAMFSVAVRLAMPIVGLLLLVDVAMGVLGRLNAHIQIVSVSIPVKMLVTILLLAMMLPILPRVYERHAETVLTAVRGFMIPR